MKPKLNFPTSFSQYCQNHDSFWKQAQEFDSKFNLTIPSENQNFQFIVMIAPEYSNIAVMNNFSSEGWITEPNLNNLPLDVLKEYVELKEEVEEWRGI